jgi:trans-2,3-dihydro-3-hydroxyanthranilate isomerase
VTDSAQRLRFDVVDVFTDRPYAGNPLAVVHGAEALDTAQLAAIAGEFNLSETVFPLTPTQPGASYRARIFTPVEELPFAGHPSVGVAWVLARDGVIGAGDAVQECGAGLLPVHVDAAGARVAGGRPGVGARLDGAALAEAVGLTAADVDSGVPAGICAAGLDYPVLAVRPDAVARARAPEAEALRRVTQGLGLICVASVGGVGAGSGSGTGSGSGSSEVHARMFGPGVGVVEDPATGSASVALAVFLVDRGLLAADGESAFTVLQGAEIGRPSRLDVQVVAESGAAVRTSVGGRVVAVSAGEILIPPAHA